ncbi:MAG: TIGR02646 family protein [Lentisphaeraceae bacterium]|nr:TIGR02646 family protein [Lentisphaeraceae bacterium]
MRFIEKGNEPEVFTEWKSLETDNWQPTFRGLGGVEKRAVKTALIAEQNGTCCYCDRVLLYDDSHIEHFQPQNPSDGEEVDPLDYQNMLCSCQNKLEKGVPRHCGNLKGNWYDTELLISPMAISCERAFKFSYDGRISARNESDQAAKTTIEKLGLNIPKLNAMRESAIAVFLDDELSDEELRIFVESYLMEGGVSPFYSTIKFLFTDIIS